MPKIIISPSILAADPANLERDVRRVEAAGADYLHIDIMDGHFVPNLSYSSSVVKALRDKSKLIFDVHLMLSEPERYIDNFYEAGADIITIHQEADGDLRKNLEHIRSLGIKPGVCIKPKTPVEVLFDILDCADQFLLMTVEPGFGGQSYIRAVNDKITALRLKLKENSLNADIEVDGGITIDNADVPTAAGANVIVSGSAVFHSDDYKETISNMRKLAEEGLRKSEFDNI